MGAAAAGAAPGRCAGGNTLPSPMADPQSVPQQDRVLAVGPIAEVVSRIRTRITPALARRRHTTAIRWLSAAATMFLDMVANVNFDIEGNGELRVLETLQETSPRCVFDVGANVGDWSERAARLFPAAEIHAFEIVPVTARELSRRIERAGLGNVRVNTFGLSDEPGTVSVAHSPDFSEGASAAVVQPVGAAELI